MIVSLFAKTAATANKKQKEKNADDK